MDFWSIIKDWYNNLDFMDKVYGTIVSLALTGICKKVLSWIKPDPIKTAFKKALKKNAQNSYVLKYYKKRSNKSIEFFCNHVISYYGKFDKDLDRLYDDFRNELKKTPEGRDFLMSLQQEGIGNGLQELMKAVDRKLLHYRELEEMLSGIRENLHTHYKGKRKFDNKKDYLQRYCSRSISDKEYLNFIIYNTPYEKYKLVDIVLGKAEYKENKFILLSGAHTGKTTELERLGWELIEEGSRVPVMFKVSTCNNLRQELPALNPEVEKGLVVMIDALDERFNGHERMALYREVEGYGEEHPDVTIVLSIRANFAKEKEIKGFCKLVLHDLTYDDAKNYFESCNLGELIEYLNDRRYYEFMRNPFCLIAMADYYEINNSLPESKPDLYDFFIEKSLKKEEGKGLTNVVGFIDREKELLQRIAIGLQLMGQNSISEKELHALVGNQNRLLDLVLISGLIDGDKEKGYCFSHNSFKEFFVSKYLLSLGNLDEIKKRCCYRGMDIIKVGWYNTVALMLNQLSPGSELSRQILDWIVKDNKEMVLLIDNKLFDKETRFRIFKEIVEEYKEKDLRIADMWSSEYEDLMNFGASGESAAYLLKELSEYEYLDSHMVNVLLLLRYVRQEDIPLRMSNDIKTKVMELLRDNCDNDDYDYVFFETLENPWMLKEETVDELYEFIKDSTHPSLLKHFVRYIIRANCVEKYIVVILDKSHNIYSYNRGRATRSIERDCLYEAYMLVKEWDHIKKVLKHIANNFQMIDYSMDREREQAEDAMDALLERTILMIDSCPDAPDYVFEVLGIIAEDRYNVTDRVAQIFLNFFNAIDETQRFFDKAFDYLWSVYIDQTKILESHQDHQRCQTMVYCTTLFLTEERLDDICDRLLRNDYNGYSLLSELEDKATPEMKELIDVKMHNLFSKYWRDKNALTKWQKKEQKDYNELMDYEWFKNSVLKILDEKMPQSKEDVHNLRRMKFKFSDNEEDRLNQYVISQFYYYLNGDYLNFKALRDSVCDYEKYQNMVFAKTFDVLTSRPQKRIVISEEHKKQYMEIGQMLLKKLADGPFNKWATFNKCAEIKGLLLHHYTIEKEELIKLLPYSKCFVYSGELDGIDFSGNHYTLLNYLEEKFADDKQTLIMKLRECFEDASFYDDEQLQQWAEFVVKKHITSEYGRVIEWMINMPDHSPAYSIAKALLGDLETRKMVLKEDVMNKCTPPMRMFIYRELTNETEMNDFVVKGIEAEFDQLKDYDKKLAVLILLSKGSLMALEYLVDHTDVIDFRNVFHYQSLKAFDLLLKVYTKVVDNPYRSDYNGIIDGMGEIAKESDENMIVVHQRLTELIKADRPRYVHLNFYLEKWKGERLELSTPTMALEEVLLLLGPIDQSTEW